MIIAVASGKGGTGKTTVATNLTLYLARRGKSVSYVDCDVEEPNGHLFLNPEITAAHDAVVPVPVIDEKKCSACGTCVRLCQYNALVRIGKTVMVFPELCHGCGGCMRICPEGAIAESNRVIGEVLSGSSGSIRYAGGKLAIGEAMSPPLIRQVLQWDSSTNVSIVDAPPGTSCPVVTVVKNAGFIVLVTEPTPFGLNDLGLALAMVRILGKPHGVVINRDDPTIDDADRFCHEQNIPILARIPDSRKIAEAYSRGQMIVTAVPESELSFAALYKAIGEQVGA